MRRFLVTALTRLGYGVVEAQDADMAAKIAANSGRIDLLLSDVVLKAGNSGADFARQFAKSHPATPILLMSGHAGGVLTDDLVRDFEYHFISKPVSREQLSQKIRAILDNREPMRQSADSR